MSIAVVGCGKQGEKHLSALAKLSVPTCCSDADKQLETSVASKFGVPARSVDALLADPHVGGLVIATPTQTHFPLMKQALNSGKHVFCEKPLTGTLAEAQTLEQLEAKTGHYIMSGFIYRFVPAFERVRELADAGVLGQPCHALLRIGGRGEHRAWKHHRSYGGGVVNEMLVHMVDLALWLFGPLHEPSVHISELRMPKRVIGGQQIDADADDFILATARTASGAPLTFVADMVTPAFIQFLDAQYDNASVIGSIQPTITDQLFLKSPRCGLGAGPHSLSEGNDDLYVRQMAAFAHVVETSTPPDRNRISDTLELLTFLSALNESTEKFGN